MQSVYTANTREGSDLICLCVLSCAGTHYGGGWRACVTAGVCELMLLTLENEEQTMIKRIELALWRVGEGRGEEEEAARTGMETAVPL